MAHTNGFSTENKGCPRRLWKLNASGNMDYWNLKVNFGPRGPVGILGHFWVKPSLFQEIWTVFSILECHTSWHLSINSSKIKTLLHYLTSILDGHGKEGWFTNNLEQSVRSLLSTCIIKLVLSISNLLYIEIQHSDSFFSDKQLTIFLFQLVDLGLHNRNMCLGVCIWSQWTRASKLLWHITALIQTSNFIAMIRS